MLHRVLRNHSRCYKSITCQKMSQDVTRVSRVSFSTGWVLGVAPFSANVTAVKWAASVGEHLALVATADRKLRATAEKVRSRPELTRADQLGILRKRKLPTSPNCRGYRWFTDGHRLLQKILFSDSDAKDCCIPRAFWNTQILHLRPWLWMCLSKMCWCPSAAL